MAQEQATQQASNESAVRVAGPAESYWGRSGIRLAQLGKPLEYGWKYSHKKEAEKAERAALVSIRQLKQAQNLEKLWSRFHRRKKT